MRCGKCLPPEREKCLDFGSETLFLAILGSLLAQGLHTRCDNFASIEAELMIGKMFMLNLIYGVALLVSAQASATGVPVVSAAEDKNLAGQYVTVCGSVSEVKTISRDTFINLEGKHPNQPFYFYHYGRAFPDKKFISKDVCGTGMVVMHKNKPQIIIESPDELTIQAEKVVV